MSLLTTLGKTAKILVVWVIRFYVLVLGLWGVAAALQGAWLFAAFGLAMPVLYFVQLVYRNYRRTVDQPQQVAAEGPAQ